MTTALEHAVAQANAELGTNANSLALMNRAIEILSEPPTPAQLEVLQLIDAGLKRDGHPPTIRELGTLRGCSSTNSTASHVNELKRKGFVESAQGKARTLKVTKHGRRWLPKEAA